MACRTRCGAYAVRSAVPVKLAVNATEDLLTGSVYLNLVGYVKPRDEFFEIFFIDVNGLIGRSPLPKVAHVLLLNLEPTVDYHVSEHGKLLLDR